MKQLFVVALSIVVAYSTFAGAGGIVVKGIAKTWDEIAKIALQASGKSVTDDAVKTASKTIENAVSKYGDDVAEAAMRGGVEVAEQSLKHGDDFVSILRRAGTVSDEAIKSISCNADDVVKYAARYGDDVAKLGAKTPSLFTHVIALVEKSGAENTKNVLTALARDIPPEQITQVFGAIERNPNVAGQFLDGIARRGKYFVDKIFAMNRKQIMAGGMTVAMIEVALGVKKRIETPPPPVIDPHTVTQLINEMDEDGKKDFLDKLMRRFFDSKDKYADAVKYPAIIIASLLGLALFLVVVRKTRSVQPVELEKDHPRQGLARRIARNLLSKTFKDKAIKE